MNENKIRVAVVDDDESFARAIGRLLRAAGFETAVFNSAETFLHGLGAEPVNCLVLDIQLGGMSGFDLRRRLVEMAVPIPVIFVTALEEEPPHEIRRGDCVACFHKPVSGRLLVEAIRRAADPDNRMKSDLLSNSRSN